MKIQLKIKALEWPQASMSIFLDAQGQIIPYPGRPDSSVGSAIGSSRAGSHPADDASKNIDY